jgi:glycerol-3-phosphate dehydrogenase
VCPYELTIAAVENAVTNGADFLRNFEGNLNTKKQDGSFGAFKSDTRGGCRFRCKFRGCLCRQRCGDVRDTQYILFRARVNTFLFDKTAAGMVNHVVFQCPTIMGKGVLIAPTFTGM